MFVGLRERLRKLSRNIFNRQVGIFLIFIVISTVLWFVTSLNDEVSRQITCQVRVVNVPDSVTFISQPPRQVTASVRIHGTEILRQIIGSEPVLNINFRDFASDNRFVVTRTGLLELVQSRLGDDSQLQAVYPDSIAFYYTSAPPKRMPVTVCVTASAAPSVHIFGTIVPLTDSVEVYSVGDAARRVKSIPTADMHFVNIERTTVVKVPLRTPPGCRAVPDSIEVRINVEPYVTETRLLDVEAINMPSGYEVMLDPMTVKASYRVPMSMRKQLPEVKVLADFSTVNDTLNAGNVAINTDPWVSYIFLDQDSVAYYINAGNE